MKKLSILGMVLFSMFLSFGISSSQSGQELFQRALAKERAEGNLEEAIVLYQRVINESQDKALKAKSQLCIGMCYEKLGQKSVKLAQDAFQKVIDNYPSQSDEVRIAKEKLAILLKDKFVVEKENKEIRIQKVKQLDVLGAPSPDGRLISYVDWETGNGELAIMEIATGEKHSLIQNNPGDESWYFVNHSIFSPDGKKLAYTRWKDNNMVDFNIINVDGSGKRVLLSDREIYYFEPSGWTPDGKYILGVLTKKDRTNHAAFVSVSDGNIRIIKEYGQNEPGELSLSSDGRWIAHDIPQNKEPGKHDIFFLSVDGNREVPLVKHPADDRLLGWALNGKWILFSSDRSGTWDAWVIPVKDGKPNGDPMLVKRDFGQVKELGIVPMGFTQDDSFYYGVRMWSEDVYVAALDINKAELLAPPKKAILSFEGSNNNPVWSPDGKYLAYISRRKPEGLKVICIHTLETADEYELYPELEDFGGLSWLPDGKSLLVVGRNNDDQGGVFKVDSRTGELSLVMTHESRHHCTRLSPDGKKLFFAADSWEEKTFRIISYNLETKQEKELYRSSYQIFRMDLSPDGKWLAFRDYADNTIKVISTEGGEANVLLELESGVGINCVTWSHDGKYILISKMVEKGGGKVGRCELWGIPANGREPVKYGMTVDGLIGLSVHPDGKLIAFVSWRASSAVWVMENFLPKLKDKK